MPSKSPDSADRSSRPSKSTKPATSSPLDDSTLSMKCGGLTEQMASMKRKVENGGKVTADDVDEMLKSSLQIQNEFDVMKERCTSNYSSLLRQVRGLTRTVSKYEQARTYLSEAFRRADSQFMSQFTAKTTKKRSRGRSNG